MKLGPTICGPFLFRWHLSEYICSEIADSGFVVNFSFYFCNFLRLYTHAHLYIKGTVQRCPKLGGEANSATDGRKFIHDSRSRQNCAGNTPRSVSHAGIYKSINFLSDTFELSTVKMLPSTQLIECLQDQGVQKRQWKIKAQCPLWCKEISHNCSVQPWCPLEAERCEVWHHV